MPLRKIGINISNLNNISSPNFDFNKTASEWANEIPSKANEASQGFLGVIILSILWAYFTWEFSRDPQQGGSFGYSNWRGQGLAFSICSILGIFCLNLGYFVNFYHVVIFIVGAVISIGVVWKSTN